MPKLNPQTFFARLEAGRFDTHAANYDESELAGLPAQVQRYFRAVLRQGQPRIAGARVCHAGAFRTSGSSTGWRPFSSTEVFTTTPPGFVWDASIRTFPGMRVHVLDSYIGTTASMSAAIFGFIPIVTAVGAPELDAGALQRYLAEAVWLPTALLPRQGVQWQPVSDTKALATLVDGRTRISLEFEFNSEGEIISAFTPSRYREVKGSYKPTPWACRYANYAERDGMRVPMEGEVEWHLPEGPLSYWRGLMTNIRYDYMTAEAAVKDSGSPKKRIELYRERSEAPHP